MPYDIGVPWEERREGLAAGVLREFETVVPGISGSANVVEIATPLTLERYTRNQAGAMLGWETTPQNSGSRRLAIDTPVAGLYLAGHWTQPGAGSLRVLVSGVMGANRVLAQVGGQPLEIPLAIASVWEPRRLRPPIAS